MTTSRFTTLAGPAIAEIEVKRSRFLCELTPVGAGDDEASEVAARAVVEVARKQHWDARHHCSAFVLGPQRQVRRSNDDGEPSGTAGAPMLEALVASGLSDVVAVVTRWFGGTLLGAGGLVRAYGDVVRAALAEARVVTYECRLVMAADVGIADVGRVENALRAAGRHVEGVDYAQGAASGTARLVLAVTEADRAALESELASLTGGSADLDECGQRWVSLADQPG
ncbi:YigZ family protein [Dermacoccus nishinomiyaensis]|uniref:IMPACT family protein n=1 Tax=Dermacoccus nishinomiyaensis TaxID=1274 RepID=UPI000DFB6996|nr:YigZ family protein [Dermacoccus nishinomiyaensis]QQY24460.1 YigZ family protein [Dermacoccus nishinomiyaensis]STD20073.1 IMPACT family member yigZ [Dermacoccus nishinomiyaensis]